MTIQEEFYNRIDNDSGYDNQKLGDDLIKIAEKHHKEQLSLCSVVECKHDFEPYYNWCSELAGYRCEKCGEEKE